MNKNIQNKLAMYKVVRQLMQENQVAWSPIPAIEGAFDEFKTKLTELEDLAVKQSSNITGAAVSNSKLREKTIDQARVVAAALQVHATASKDDVLKAKVTLKWNSLTNIARENMLAKTEEMIQIAAELISELAPFGITPAHLEELSTNFEQLKTVSYQPRNEIIQRKQYTHAMSDVSKEINGILKSSIDPLMKIVKTMDATFYEKYRSARMIIDYGVKHKLPPMDGNATGMSVDV